MKKTILAVASLLFLVTSLIGMFVASGTIEYLVFANAICISAIAAVPLFKSKFLENVNITFFFALTFLLIIPVSIILIKLGYFEHGISYTAPLIMIGATFSTIHLLIRKKSCATGCGC